METKPRNSVVNRIGAVEPVISLAYRFYDFIVAYWPQLIAAAGVGSVMSTLASLTEWVNSYGVVVVGAIGLIAAILTWLSILVGLSLRAKKRLFESQSKAVSEWSRKADTVNPLASEFHTKRLNIGDLSSPLDSRIKGKRFIDCELIGPAVIFFYGNSVINGAGFANCDFVAVKDGSWINNAIVFEDATILNGVFWRCTILMSTEMIKRFGIPVSPISLTGDVEIDQRVSAAPIASN